MFLLIQGLRAAVFLPTVLILVQGLRAAVFLLIQGLRTDVFLLIRVLYKVCAQTLHVILYQYSWRYSIDEIPVSYCMLLLEPGPESRGRCHPLRELLKFCSLGLVAFPIELLLVYCRNLGT